MPSQQGKRFKYLDNGVDNIIECVDIVVVEQHSPDRLLVDGLLLFEVVILFLNRKPIRKECRQRNTSPKKVSVQAAARKQCSAFAALLLHRK